MHANIVGTPSSGSEDVTTLGDAHGESLFVIQGRLDNEYADYEKLRSLN